MLPSLFSSTTIPALQETLNFAEARHAVLAGNIANVNTPGYRTRDLSVTNFQERLKELLAARPAPRATSPGHLLSQPDEPLREVRETLTNVLYHDDTNIDLEKQVAEVSKNQALHNMAIALLSSQFQQLHSAISERV